jgi:hypothetical protein
VFVGLSQNLRHHGSLTSPTNPGWLLMSPAEAATRRGFIPIPDFAPLYPALGAVTRDPVSAFTAVGVVSVAMLLLAVGSLVVIATGSILAGVAAQILLIVGPLAMFRPYPRITLLDLSATIQSDVLAAACLMAGLAFLAYSAERNARSTLIAGATLLAASELTRFAFTGAAFGVAVVCLDQWRRSRSRYDRDRLLVVALAAVAAPVWMVGYQLATDSGSAKALEAHFASVGRIGAVILGWFGIASPAGWINWLVLVATGIALLVLAVFAYRSLWLRLLAAAGFGYLVLHILTVQFLDAGYAYATERTLLPVRMILVVLVVSGITKWVGREHTARRIVSVVGLVAVWIGFAGSYIFQAPFTAVPQRPTFQQLDAMHLPMLATNGDSLYLSMRRPILELPSSVQESTGDSRDVHKEALHLAQALKQQGDQFLVLRTTELRVLLMTAADWPKCVRTQRLSTVDSTFRYIIHLDSCHWQHAT